VLQFGPNGSLIKIDFKRHLVETIDRKSGLGRIGKKINSKRFWGMQVLKSFGQFLVKKSIKVKQVTTRRKLLISLHIMFKTSK